MHERLEAIETALRLLVEAVKSPAHQRRIDVHHHFDDAELHALIDALQGSVSPADQALLNAIESRARRQTAKLAALDAKVPPPKK